MFDPDFNTVAAFSENLPLAILIIDGQEHLAAINAAARALFDTAVTGRHYLTLFRQPELIRAIELARENAKSIEATFAIHDGEAGERIFDARVIPFERVKNALILSLTDRTPLLSATQIRRDFLANVSHELRTPLTALSGFIETLKGPAQNDQKARNRFLDVMAHETTRMNRLVEDLLTLSHLEGHAPRTLSERVCLRDIVHLTLSTLGALIEDQRITIDIETSGDVFELKGVSDQLIQVFQNLIENAVKYGGPEKTITIRFETLDRDKQLSCRTIGVEIRDQGEGIDPIHLPRLTQRFYRVDSHRARARGGTGLGLAIVKHIIQRHGGRLQIESTLGAGTAVSVFFPQL